MMQATSTPSAVTKPRLTRPQGQLCVQRSDYGGVTRSGVAKWAVGAALAAMLAWASPASAVFSIGRADADGTKLEPSFIKVAGGGASSDIAVSSDHIFWLNGESIGRANL